MSYKCNECGEIFDYPKKVSESRGEFWGMPAFEDMYYCPCCSGEDFEEYTGEDDDEDEEFDDISAEDLMEWQAASCGMDYYRYRGKPETNKEVAYGY